MGVVLLMDGRPFERDHAGRTANDQLAGARQPWIELEGTMSHLAMLVDGGGEIGDL